MNFGLLYIGTIDEIYMATLEIGFVVFDILSKWIVYEHY